MNNMWKYIPPLASDYSGVCSLLYHSNSFNILYSPGGCNQPIREVDESKNLAYTNLYTTKLNDIDIVQGIDEKLMENLKGMDLEKFDFITLIGTFATDITGVNLKRTAKKIEKHLGKSVLYFQTNSFESYPIGISEAYVKLAEFMVDKDPKPCTKKIVNILGYNPMVLGDDRHVTYLLECLKNEAIQFHLPGLKTDDTSGMELSSQADLNLVISEEGRKTAEIMEEKYQIPFHQFLPIGISAMLQLLSDLEKKLGISLAANKNKLLQFYKPLLKKEILLNEVLILGEPFVSLAIGRCLQEDFGLKNIKILSFLNKKSKSAKIFTREEYQEVIFTMDEQEIAQAISEGEVIVADPLYKEVFAKKDQSIYIPLPYFGLSGREFADVPYEYLGEKGVNYLKKHLKKMEEFKCSKI